jgi:hypothetical protein
MKKSENIENKFGYYDLILNSIPIFSVPINSVPSN